jgi:hypothetical protein
MTQSTPSGPRSKPRSRVLRLLGLIFIVAVIIVALGHVIPLKSKNVHITTCGRAEETFLQSVRRYHIYGSKDDDLSAYDSLVENGVANDYALDCAAMLGGHKISGQTDAKLYLW